MRDILLKPRAEAEVEEAYQWYEERREGLGSDFLLSIEETLEKLRRDPDMYPTAHGAIHRALIRRFPYGIFHVFTDTVIVVLAILHASRNPDRNPNQG